ncbi:von Willebrand factor type A domain-containing protein [Flavobacterium sp. MAH-1]|uniref:von Willebrand factor type A domain-containing protein n=1 Tax=Flavobacterium agri TaxID=2743471 RepID=A0A7Y8Y362_9FLAO|nr:VWA domain-containing protein [Flavobacterium agri]NUY81074.1 von Willebrand factor type A domain-containing protein [Flavobacterium agri]NYA71098.1 von Willebrand factor type A domain-containing protein [Flavobacterium agri]
MKQLKIVSLGVAMLISFLCFAGNRNTELHISKIISGRVTDASGALPGVSINVKGGKTTVSTDVNGMYSIEAKEGDILIFSYIGYKTQKIRVGKTNTIDVILLEDVQTLGEVIVQSQADDDYDSKPYKQREQTESKKDKSAQPAPNAVMALQGKALGVKVNTTNSAVNSSTRVVLRGNRSLTQNNEALVVIDGKVASTAEYQKLAPDQIDNVNVLKGAQGTALYGQQGANGVIVVNTKSGAYQIQNAVEPNDEDYDSFVENAFTSPKNEPLSTFSIDVDNASYTNVRRFLNNGQKVPKDAVRVEEMVNFFKYDYPQPKGEHPFSINTEIADCPWNANNKIVKIGLQGKNIPTDNLPSSNFVFLIDVSGSMSSYNKLPLLKASMKLLVAQLRDEDKVSMVVYAGAAGMVLPPTKGSEKAKIIAALDNLEVGGSTAGGAGIELAYKTASENFIKGGNNRVILATDGDFNVGASSNSDMETLIEEKRKSGVFLTVLGYGMGNYKDSKMEILADKGNGNYAYIDNIQEANRFLVKEFNGSMYAIAKDVKIQIEFNPKHVQSYRLIGYENRKLRPEDFTNDAIDAGELGSGHNVTALYEIIPQGVKSEFFNESTNLKYTDQKNVDPKFTDELATVKFRYKKPDGDKSTEMVHVIGTTSQEIAKASADMQFATAVAWFGLKLRESKLISNISTEDIKKLAKQGLSKDADGYRAEFIRLVESAQTLGYAKN